jgi:hypothetical protein
MLPSNRGCELRLAEAARFVRSFAFALHGVAACGMVNNICASLTPVPMLAKSCGTAGLYIGWPRATPGVQTLRVSGSAAGVRFAACCGSAADRPTVGVCG